jgi:hypothetical protein
MGDRQTHCASFAAVSKLVMLLKSQDDQERHSLIKTLLLCLSGLDHGGVAGWTTVTNIYTVVIVVGSCIVWIFPWQCAL